MKKILIGTHNAGKFKEISFLLSKKIRKTSPKNLKIKSPKETGKTFVENAKLKANFFSKFTNLPVIADDSGLCIKSLGGKPGVHSARLAKKYGGFPNAMKVILKKLKKKRNRTAFFICSLSFKYPNNKLITVSGKITGLISHKILGKKGFGYDSIFIPKGEIITFGQMSKLKKLKIDHRYVAFKKLKKKVSTL